MSMQFDVVHDNSAHAMSDIDVCRAVGEDLTAHYPGYPWMVGCNHEKSVGRVVIDLGVTKPVGMENYAYALYLPTVLGPGGQKRVLEAGGELLERFGLKRGAAAEDHRQRARENGLDLGGAVHTKREHLSQQK
jgi:hypothetical protein